MKQQEKLRILPMAREMVDDIVALEEACFAHPWQKQTLLSELANPTARFLAALREGQVVGYLGANLIAGECYIADLAVRPDERRRGIASLLLQTLTEQMQAEQAAFLTLEVRVSNKEAIALYQKAGFRCVGVRPRFYDDPPEDARIMTKYL